MNTHTCSQNTHTRKNKTNVFHFFQDMNVREKMRLGRMPQWQNWGTLTSVGKKAHPLLARLTLATALIGSGL